MKESKLYKKAKEDFERMAKNTSPEVIQEKSKTYGLDALFFAKMYCDKESMDYHPIYNIWYDFFRKIVENK